MTQSIANRKRQISTMEGKMWFKIMQIYILWSAIAIAVAFTTKDKVLGKCNEVPVGMENGRIPDGNLRATSSHEIKSVGPQNARVRTNRNGGAWCPKDPILLQSKEYLEINFGRILLVTSTETQGRYGNGNGKEYTEQFVLHYHRPSVGWKTYKDYRGNAILTGNNDTNTSVIQQLNLPFHADKIRFVPRSLHPRVVCLRAEVYTCDYKQPIISYSMPEPDAKHDDISYDGDRSTCNLSGGLGQLVDGVQGVYKLVPVFECADNNTHLIMYPERNNSNVTTLNELERNEFMDASLRWVGWSNNNFTKHYVDIVFEFSEHFQFSAVHIQCARDRHDKILPFRSAYVFFDVEDDNFYQTKVIMRPSWRRMHNGINNVTLTISVDAAKKLKLRLFFSAQWLIINEVWFTYAPITVNLTEYIAEKSYAQYGNLSHEEWFDDGETVDADINVFDQQEDKRKIDEDDYFCLKRKLIISTKVFLCSLMFPISMMTGMFIGLLCFHNERKVKSKDNDDQVAGAAQSDEGGNSSEMETGKHTTKMDDDDDDDGSSVTVSGDDEEKEEGGSSNLCERTGDRPPLPLPGDNETTNQEEVSPYAVVDLPNLALNLLNDDIGNIDHCPIYNEPYDTVVGEYPSSGQPTPLSSAPIINQQQSSSTVGIPPPQSTSRQMPCTSRQIPSISGEISSASNEQISSASRQIPSAAGVRNTSGNNMSTFNGQTMISTTSTHITPPLCCNSDRILSFNGLLSLATTSGNATFLGAAISSSNAPPPPPPKKEIPTISKSCESMDVIMPTLRRELPAASTRKSMIASCASACVGLDDNQATSKQKKKKKKKNVRAKGSHSKNKPLPCITTRCDRLSRGPRKFILFSEDIYDTEPEPSSNIKHRANRLNSSTSMYDLVTPSPPDSPFRYSMPFDDQLTFHEYSDVYFRRSFKEIPQHPDHNESYENVAVDEQVPEEEPRPKRSRKNRINGGNYLFSTLIIPKYLNSERKDSTERNEFPISKRHDNAVEIDSCQLIHVRDIGENEFGKIQIGQFVTRCDDQKVRQKFVLMKTLNTTSDQDTRDAFAKECRRMSKLYDLNISRVIGFSEQPYRLLQDYSPNGNLNTFIREHAKKDFARMMQALSSTHLMYFISQIASGMRYLEAEGIIHRDMSTRNCLIDTGLVIKISDHAIYEAKYAGDYYPVTPYAKIPLRWIAWESHALNEYSSKSDVWSFGITIWEILSFCQESPYPELTDEQVFDNINDFSINSGHQRVPIRPAVCTEPFYRLLNQCWSRSPNHRPTFRNITLKLKSEISSYTPIWYRRR